MSDFSGPAVVPQWRTHPGEFFKKSKEGVEMEGVLAIRDEYRAQNWAMVIQECNSSGLSNREFCRQRGTL